MQKVKYSVTFNDDEVTETSTPMKLLQNDLQAIRTQFYTEDHMYLDTVQTLIVRAELRFGDNIVMTSQNRRRRVLQDDQTSEWNGSDGEVIQEEENEASLADKFEADPLADLTVIMIRDPC